MTAQIIHFPDLRHGRLAPGCPALWHMILIIQRRHEHLLNWKELAELKRANDYVIDEWDGDEATQEHRKHWTLVYQIWQRVAEG